MKNDSWNQLREKRKISQEQLALMAGLSVRTIQRIERGHKASFESLKSLASVLEVKLSTLEQEIEMIDKTTDEWKNYLFCQISICRARLSVDGNLQKEYLCERRKGIRYGCHGFSFISTYE